MSENNHLPTISVIGLGNLGTALAHWISHNAHTLGWAHSQSVADEINQFHTNINYLSNYKLHPKLTADTDIAAVVENAEIIFLCLPARHTKDVIKKIIPHLSPSKIIINTSKGMNIEMGIPIYDFLTHQIQGKSEIIQLAGPMVANEFARGSKTLGIMSRPNRVARSTIQQLFKNTPLEFQFTTDTQGLIWGSLLKNIYTIGWGIIEVTASENMNLKGIYITKAFQEMVDISKKEGAFCDTLYGLSGLGDFMATSLSIHSHNRIYGMHIASSHNSDHQNVDLPEGYFSLKALHQRYGDSINNYPLLSCINQILNSNRPSHTLIDLIPS